MLQSVWKNPVHFLAFGFGSGVLPIVPGTWGTLAAVPIYLAIQDWPWSWYAILVVVMAVVGIGLCGKTSRDLNVHDHPGIVWDEFVGFLITMFLAPRGWLFLILGFVYFRIIDVFKPWPINIIDKRVSGGLGIMADDWLAGIYALVALQFSGWLFLRFFAN